MFRMTFRRIVGAAASVLLLSIVSSRPATGQDEAAGSCMNVVSAAHAAYQNAEYERTVDLLVPCIHSPRLTGDSSIEAYRTLSLAYLKLNDISSARTALIHLLSANPTYRADPVADLPSYRSLVDLLRRQLGLESRAPSIVSADTLLGPSGPDTLPDTLPGAMDAELALQDDSMNQAQYRQAYYNSLLPFGHLLITMSGGISAYGGERGANAESFFGEFGRNAGPKMKLLVEYGITPALLVGLSYSASSYPHVSSNKWMTGPYPELSESSSDWVHALSIEMRGRLRATYWFYPYASYGVATTYHFMNGSFSAGVGPMLGIGADFQVDPMFALFLEMDSALIFPGTALDMVDHKSSFDPLTTVSAGVRIRAVRLLR